MPRRDAGTACCRTSPQGPMDSITTSAAIFCPSTTTPEMCPKLWRHGRQSSGQDPSLSIGWKQYEWSPDRIKQGLSPCSINLLPCIGVSARITFIVAKGLHHSFQKFWSMLLTMIPHSIAQPQNGASDTQLHRRVTSIPTASPRIKKRELGKWEPILSC